MTNSHGVYTTNAVPTGLTINCSERWQTAGLFCDSWSIAELHPGQVLTHQTLTWTVGCQEGSHRMNHLPHHHHHPKTEIATTSTHNSFQLPLASEKDQANYFKMYKIHFFMFFLMFFFNDNIRLFYLDINIVAHNCEWLHPPFFLEKNTSYFLSYFHKLIPKFLMQLFFFFPLARDPSDTPYAYFWLSTALNPIPHTGRPIIPTPEEI